MRGDIDRGEQGLAFAPHIYGFVSECRESRKATEHADENQRARLSREEAARLRQLRKQTDRETTDEIHGERAVRKIDAATEVLDEAADGITEHGTNESADACQK